MRYIRKALVLCGQELRKWKKDYKLYLILVLLLLFLLQYTQWLFDYAKSMNYPVSPWLLPFLMSSRNGRLIVYGFEILFFSTLFNRQRIHQYEILRCGYRAYLLGKNFYIIVAAFLYACMAELLTILPHLPQIYFATDWGKLLGAWAKQQQSRIYISTYILNWYTAFSGMAYSFLLLWLTGCILGQSLFLLNSIKGKMYGTVFAGILLCFDFTVMGTDSVFLRALLTHLSPLSWSNLELLQANGIVTVGGSPTIAYAVIMSVVIILLLPCVMFILLRISVRAGSRHQWFQLFG